MGAVSAGLTWIGAVLGAAASECADADTDWPQLQRTADRRGYSPAEVHPPLRARWIWFGPDFVVRNVKSKPGDANWTDDLTSAEGKDYRMPDRLEFGFSQTMQPIAAGGRIFVADAQRCVYALDADDGSTLWTAELPGGAMWSGVADAGIVAFASVPGRVYAFDAATGARRWTFDTGKAVTSAPALVGDVLFVAGQSGTVHALRLDDGKRFWESAYLGAPIQGGLCVANGKVFAGTEAMEAVGLDAATGELFARHKVMGQSFRLTWPVAVGDRVVFVTAGTVCVGSEYVNDPVIAGRDGYGSVGWDPDIKPAYADAAAEEEAVRRWLAGPGRQYTCHHVLRADNLGEDYVLGTGPTEGCGQPPNPPAVDGQGRPILWWASGFGTLIPKCGFGTNFTTDLSRFDLATGQRVLINNGRPASGQTTETDNLYAMAVGGRYLYLRQNFRGTSMIDLGTSQHWRISAVYRRHDGGGWHSPINYAQGDGGKVRAPSTPACTAGRVAPIIASGRLYFTETFAVTCAETDQ